MKTINRIIILLLIVGFSLSACSMLTYGEEIGSDTEALEIIALTETEEIQNTKAASPKFTIVAEEMLQPALTKLYTAYYPGETPVFLEQGGELAAIHEYKIGGEHPQIPAAFLPNGYLIPQSESREMLDFIDYAISEEGERKLIDEGFLPASITVTDQAGNTVEITQPIERVISTNGPATSFIYGVNAQNRLVSASYLGARDAFGAATMERIDPRFQELYGDEYFTQELFSIEQSISLDPDLIIASARTSWLETADELGFSVVLYDAETPERLVEAIRLTGELFGPREMAYADVWIAYYHRIVETIREQTAVIPNDERPRVLFTGTDALKVASGNMYQTSMIEFAGGISVSSELSGYWQEVNLEQIALWGPDVIIVPPYGGASVGAIVESQEWQILDAVQKGQVYRMPKLVVPWDTPAPDSVLGIVWLAQLLNPGTIDLDCSVEANYFYNTFYNYKITEDEIATICTFD